MAFGKTLVFISFVLLVSHFHRTKSKFPYLILRLLFDLKAKTQIQTRVSHTFISPSADLRRAVVSYWRKYVHKVLVNHLGGLSLPRKSVVRLSDHPDMTLTSAVYRGCKTTTQQQQQQQARVSQISVNCHI